MAGKYGKHIKEVIDLIKGGQGKLISIRMVAEKCELNLNGLTTACYSNADFRKLVHSAKGRPKLSGRGLDRALLESPADATRFMSEFFRYLSYLQETAEEAKCLRQENVRLRAELERMKASDQDHYASVMARARQQFLDGQPER